jgi:DNA (cytosine-5)-methyltransferase 1
MDWGFHCAGFEAVLALDSCPDAVLTYNHNSERGAAQKANLARLRPEQLIEMVPPDAHPVGFIGGPPCQGFSRGNAAGKPSDPRNMLPYRYAALLKAANARYGLHFFVFENVVGLTTKKHAGRLKRIRSKLEAAGFRLFDAKLNASAFGVPQRRLRLFLVGLNRDLYPRVGYQFPQGRCPEKHVIDVLGGLPVPLFYRRGTGAADIPFHPNHWTMMPKSPKFKSGKPSNGRSFKRLDWNAVSPTVAYGHREIHVHPDGGRRLSVYEAMLLQGFPSDYQMIGSLSSQITQVSNAVPPPVAEAIANSLITVLALGAPQSNATTPCSIRRQSAE